MPQISGQPASAETISDEQTPDAVPVTEPEKTERMTQEESLVVEVVSSSLKNRRHSQKKAPAKKAPRKKAPQKTTRQLLIGLLIKLAVAAALIWAVFTFVLGMSVHYGNNMYPAIRDGDLLVSYRMQKPFINAVVLYRVNGKTEVGRVIALEGSVVDIAENGSLTVNGAMPSEEVFYATYPAENSAVSFPYTVEPGKVFILNDFRNDTNDSRTFGAIDRKDLQGPLLFAARRRNF